MSDGDYIAGVVIVGRIVMVAEEKRAWLVIGACALALIILLVLIPLTGATRAVTIVFVGCVLAWVIARVLFHKRLRAGEVARDERDKAIEAKALVNGGMASYLAVLATCALTWGTYFYQGKDVIPAGSLIRVVQPSLFVFFLAWAVTILILYGRERTDGQD